MEREIDLQEISDGKLYTNKDMVKAGCGECQGCSDCCRGMGSSIFLDPMDIYRLTTGLECSFEDLLSTCVELHVVDGFIQPNMKMVGKEEQCPFLNEKGRCNIHAIRPGICRLFPLGRCYDGEGGFQYFLQIYECKKEPKSKVKIKKLARCGRDWKIRAVCGTVALFPEGCTEKCWRESHRRLL